MYFFTEHSELEPQTAAEAYGALSSIEYRISSLFKTTIPTKAFACQEGQIIVQQSQLSADLVNVVLQPTDELQHHIKPQYYIYRGIRKDSLINGANIIQPANGTSEFIGRYFSQNPTEFGAELLGYNNSSDGDLRLEELFALPEPNSYTTRVNAGEWFGMFDNQINATNRRVEFEIVIDSRLFKFNLDYLRSEHYTISVAGLSVGLELRIRREVILAFIDPAAFFGSLYNKGVTLISYPNDVKTENTFKKQNLYNSVLFGSNSNAKFITCNTVYLDIRSEKGFSYNFYQNYGDSGNGHNFDLVYGGSNPNQIYDDNGWPIISVNALQGVNDVNKIIFRLRIDDNRKPIIYLTDPKVLNPNSQNPTQHFLKKADILDNVSNPSHDWSRNITLKYRNVTTGSNRLNIANYLRIYYFRQQLDAADVEDVVVPNSVLIYDRYYNGAFCPINFDGNTFRSAHPVYVRENMNDDGTGNFGFAAENGVYKDGDRVIFYAKYNGVGKPVYSGKKYLPTYEKKLELSNPDYQTGLKSSIHTIVRDYPVEPFLSRRIPGINAFYDKKILKEKEDAMLLGLTNAELNTIRDADGLSDIHEKYFYLLPVASNPLIDTDNKRYHEFILHLQGLDDDGNSKIIKPMFNNPSGTPKPLTLYSRDKVFYSSDDFGQMEETTSGENNLEFHIYPDGIIKTMDNIDLSLVRKSVLTGREDLSADDEIIGDQSIVEEISYKYHSVPLLDQGIELCRLNVVMANKMERKQENYGIISGIPSGFIQFIDYNSPAPVDGVDADISYKNGDGDIVTTGTSHTRKYINQKKKVFMVKLESSLINSSVLIDPNMSDDKFLFTRTLRYFGNPAYVSSFLGALVQINHNILSTGISYGDGSCYPSLEHVNGLAMDTLYNSNDKEVNFILALRLFGFQSFRIGLHKTSLANLLDNYSSLDGLIKRDTHNMKDRDVSLHDSHLHSTKLVIEQGFKPMPS